MVNHLQSPQLLPQRSLIGFKRANTSPIRGTFNRCILEDGRFIFLTRWPHLDAPSFDMVASAGIDLHIIPIVAREVLHHRLGERIWIPFALEVVTPHAGRHAVYRITSQSRVYSFFFIHYISFLVLQFLKTIADT